MSFVITQRDIERLKSHSFKKIPYGPAIGSFHHNLAKPIGSSGRKIILKPL
jgi:hypothetical protein